VLFGEVVAVATLSILQVRGHKFANAHNCGSGEVVVQSAMLQPQKGPSHDSCARFAFSFDQDHSLVSKTMPRFFRTLMVASKSSPESDPQDDLHSHLPHSPICNLDK
jgi:hypothetical protein